MEVSWCFIAVRWCNATGHPPRHVEEHQAWGEACGSALKVFRHGAHHRTVSKCPQHFLGDVRAQAGLAAPRHHLEIRRGVLIVNLS